MVTYEERRAARQERLDARADKARAEAAAQYARSRAAVEHIPFGQPILVDHYSAKGHRRAIERSHAAMTKACEASKEAERLESTAPTAAVLASDSDALDVLRADLAEAKAAHARMLAANKALRAGKGAAGLVALGFTEAQAADLTKPGRFAGPGFASFSLTNSSARIRAAEKRIAALERIKASSGKDYMAGDVRVVEDVEAVRLRLIFPGRPDAATIAVLKSRGFRWAPSEGAWQRQLNNAARWAAKDVLSVHATQGSNAP